MTLARWLDSATPPTSAQVAQAKAAGYTGWAGYLATKTGVKLARPWSDAEFHVVLTGGLQSLGYCSGWDDPVAVKARAAGLGIPVCLDVEYSIRADGAWVQSWVDAAMCGVYGAGTVHNGRRAAFHILSGGPWWTGGTAPVADWYTPLGPRPSGPTGWQWRGSHPEFGDGVDDSYFDDSIGSNVMTQDQATAIASFFIRSLQLLGADIGGSDNETTATTTLATAILGGDSATAISLANGGRFGAAWAGPVADALVRSLQHMGVDLGSDNEPTATADLALAFATGDANKVFAVIDGAKFPAATSAGVTMDQVRAEIAKALQAGAQGA